MHHTNGSIAINSSNVVVSGHKTACCLFGSDVGFDLYYSLDLCSASAVGTGCYFDCDTGQNWCLGCIRSVGADSAESPPKPSPCFALLVLKLKLGSHLY